MPKSPPWLMNPLIENNWPRIGVSNALKRGRFKMLCSDGGAISIANKLKHFETANPT